MESIEELSTHTVALAARLRALREATNMTGKQLASRLGWYPSKISRLERGHTVPSAEDLAQWATACDAAPAEWHVLEKLRAELELSTAAHRDWRRRLRSGHAAVQTDYDQRIAATTIMSSLETVFIPGMLQTPAYARCVIEEMHQLHETTGDVDAAVAARMHRQRWLYDQTKRFGFLLAEPVLLWGVCPREVMLAQIDRLTTAATLPHVRLGVLPLGRRLTLSPQHGFTLYDSTAVVETFTSELVYRGDDAESYARILALLWESALEGEDALRLLRGTMTRI